VRQLGGSLDSGVTTGWAPVAQAVDRLWIGRSPVGTHVSASGAVNSGAELARQAKPQRWSSEIGPYCGALQAGRDRATLNRARPRPAPDGLVALGKRASPRLSLHPQRGSNPCLRLEGAVSWAARRWGLDDQSLGHGCSAVTLELRSTVFESGAKSNVELAGTSRWTIVSPDSWLLGARI